MLLGRGRAAVVVAGLDGGVDEGPAAVVCGFVVGDEGVDGGADAGVGAEDRVDAAGGFVQAFVLPGGTGPAPQVVEVEGCPGAFEVGF